MANIYWNYKNFMELASSMKDKLAEAGGTADIYDFNLETNYNPASNGTRAQILIDLGSSCYIDTAVVVHSLAGTGHIRYYYGTVYDWSFTGTMDAGHEVDNDYGTTALFDTAASAQYWGIEIDGRQYIGTGIKIYEIFLGKRLELTYNPVYPAREATHRSVTVGETPKGVRHTYHNFDRKSWLLNYEGLNSTDKNSIETMVDYCSGSYKPLWYTQDPSIPAETYFARLGADRFTYSEIISGIWHISIPLEQEL